MGGSAFVHGPNPLETPRMPEAVFRSVSQRCKQKLRSLFLCVACPIDAPGKSDFGDVDIFVSWPASSGQDTKYRETSLTEQYRHAIHLALGAEHDKTNGNIAHYAIPWPEDLAHNNNNNNNNNPTGPRSKSYIQVDVTVTASPDEMQWLLFKHAHGDLWSLLGSVIRPYGLTVDDQSLCIRIPEMEKDNRKLARVTLTREPAEVLSFLGLPDEGFWEAPFPSIQDMFEYVAQCRMFRVHAAKEDADAEMGESIKSDDRKRIKTRPVFNLWLNDFLPRCRREKRFLEFRTSRDEIRREALERFQVQDLYQRRLDEHIGRKQALHIKQAMIKATFPVPGLGAPSRDLQYRGCLVKALAKIVLDGDESYGIVPDPAHPLQNGRGVFDLENVRRFISSNHERVGAAAMALHHQSFMAKKLQSSK